MNQRFVLNRSQGKVMGVAAGLADWTGIDVLLVRLGLVAALLLTGPVVILFYVLTGWLASDRYGSASTKRATPTYSVPAESSQVRAMRQEAVMAGELAVVLSGGGAKGAFQVGVLDELITNRGVKVDIAVGTSTGSIQALAVAQDDIPKLIQMWLGLKGSSDIYSKKPLGIVGGVIGADSIYEAKGLKKLLKQNADDAKLRSTGKKLRLGVVNLGTGEFRPIDERTPGIHNWVYASCAMPVFFDPLTTSDGAQWVDGGVRDVTPLGTALELNPRGVIVVRAGAKPKPATPKSYDNLIEIGLRAVDILQKEVSGNDLANAALINDLIAAREAQLRALQAANVDPVNMTAVLRPLDVKLAEYRFAPIRVIEPEKDYLDTLKFDPAKIREAIEAGRQAVEREWHAIEPLLT